MTEFRIFKKLSQEEAEGWKNHLVVIERRVDLYFTGIPVIYGLKFRDAKVGKKNFKCKVLEIKLLQGNKWKKIISSKLDNKIKIRHFLAVPEQESINKCKDFVLQFLQNTKGLKELAEFIKTHYNDVSILPIEKKQNKQYIGGLMEEQCLLRVISKNEYYISLEIEEFTKQQLNQKCVHWQQVLNSKNLQQDCFIGSYPDFIMKIK